MSKHLIKAVIDKISIDSSLSKRLNTDTIVEYAFNAESMKHTDKLSAAESYEALKSDMDSTLTNLNLEGFMGNMEMGLEQVQKDAAFKAAVMAMGPKTYRSALMRSFADSTARADDIIVGNFESFGGGLSAIDSSYALNQEGFDGQDVTSVIYTTIALAVATSKQDDFADAFFPLVVMDPSTAFYEISIQVDNFIKEYRHITPRGIATMEDKRPILKNLFNNELLTENRLRLKPFLENDPDKEVLLEAAKYGTTVNDELFTSAPYKIGAKIDILAVTNTKGELAKGSIPDNTDALDRSITMTNLYIGFKDSNGATKDLQYKLDLMHMPRTSFQVPAEGHNKELILNFEGQFALSTKKAKDFQDKETGNNFLFGTTLQGGDDYKVEIEVSVTGNVKTDTSHIKLNASEITVVAVTKVTDGTPVTDFKSGVGEQILAEVAKWKVVGYDLDVAVTNSNFRKRSILLHTETVRFREVCEFRSGLTVLKPKYDDMGTDNDAMAATVEKQALGINALMSASAVTTLTGFADYLQDLKASTGEVLTVKTRVPSWTCLDAWYHTETINLKDVIDSPRSYERLEDIAAAIKNKLISTVALMGIESNYFNVFEKTYPNKRKCVILGTTPYIATFLGQQLQPAVNASVSSNIFPLTHDTDAIIVTTNNPLMKDRLIVSFGIMDDPNRNKAPNLLTFGHCLYTPPFNREVQVTKGNSTYTEVHVDPRFKYVPNMAVMADFRVEGVEQAIRKNVQHHKVVTQ